MNSTTREFCTALSDIEVSNVYLYVGDAVRWDHCPEILRQRGTTIQTIAASTHSPSSFASLLTGQYTPTHGVETFTDRIPSTQSRITDCAANARFLNSIFAYADRKHGHGTDPIYSVLDLGSPSTKHPFSGLESPFLTIERGPGGHAPYGDFAGTGPAYYQLRGNASSQQLRTDYARSVALDTEFFINRLDDLDEQGLSEETLVIYTSDHGELLGESGMLGHNSPMRPELVYVPTVFLHPDLPTGQTLSHAPVHHVDLIATIQEILGRESQSPEQFDSHGQSLTTGLPSGPRPCYYRNEPFDTVPILSTALQYEGAWDAGGGWVFPQTELQNRLTVLLAKLSASPKRAYMRHHLLAALRSYCSEVRHYGTPDFSRMSAEQLLNETRMKMAERPTSDTTLSETAKQQLRDLGYR